MQHAFFHHTLACIHVQLHYYGAVNAVISSSPDPDASLVIGEYRLLLLDGFFYTTCIFAICYLNGVTLYRLPPRKHPGGSIPLRGVASTGHAHNLTAYPLLQ